MNSKKLMIAFVAISIAALVVSSFAVFAVARTYNTVLSNGSSEVIGEDIAPPEVSPSLPAETAEFDEETTPATDAENVSDTLTETAETSDLAETTETEVLSSEVTAAKEIPEATEATGFTLKLAGGRLVILSPDGESVYERIIDESALHPKDRNTLISGAVFPDLPQAMSAVYDLIS